MGSGSGSVAVDAGVLALACAAFKAGSINPVEPTADANAVTAALETLKVAFTNIKCPA